LIRQTKRSRHDADDREVFTVELQRLAEDVSPTAEASMPQPLANDDDFVTSRLVFFGKKIPAPDRLRSKQFEQIRGNHARRATVPGFRRR
jgi:hypothetical protein